MARRQLFPPTEEEEKRQNDLWESVTLETPKKKDIAEQEKEDKPPYYYFCCYLPWNRKDCSTDTKKKEKPIIKQPLRLLTTPQVRERKQQPDMQTTHKEDVVHIVNERLI